MVQMKLCFLISYYFRCYLYIPHGSDETASAGMLTRDISSFISHMVQMKLTFPESADI
ncbi:hypothetical protein THEYE_A2031 [Thermodesulfovibrio yellowstonii DSM 11347]|uniref:Uncharacterized protein n=1 Tax=Thermodesulfovibrio yellowstonii (strain ATCC 51303 / DSM 11347 / YP87) TaxID=289376 RepID=B5YIU4_THEYD|nr:hypothetical protein THEYE_A2031 [Thermodesulfovibrio yellowstonii DSM 11347]